MKIIENWKGVFMVVGGVSSGKSTFVKYLSSSFLEKGKRVAIIDADIGQSWIGPPITISAILLPKEKVNFSRPDCMAFTGMLSPSHDIQGYLINLKKVFEMVKREAPSVIIVDTTGLVAGKEGLNLKLQKAEILSPTMIIVFKKNSEVDDIIEALLCKKYNVYVLKAPKESKERDMNKRRDYREDIFRKYFEGSKIHRIKSSEDMEINTLVGIFNQDGNTISLGIVLGKENDEWMIYTPMDDIRENLILKKSNLKISLTGREL